MTSGARLNDFQRTCLEVIALRLADAGIPSPSHRVVEGKTEVYVHGSVGPIEFWIYEDGACFTDGHQQDAAEKQWIFEAQDYETVSDLGADFIDDLVRVAQGALEKERRLQSFVSSFAHECKDDFVGLWSILWESKRAFPEIGGPETRAVTLQIVRGLLESGQVAVGDFDSQRRFAPWPATSPLDATIAELERRWTELGRDPDIGDCAWFTQASADRPGVLDDLRVQLTQTEKEAVTSLFSIDEKQLDDCLSSVCLRSGFLVCAFARVDAVSCPFELHFSRTEPHVFNFFIGSGAEFYNYEGLENPSDRVEVAEDLDRFLHSAVRCERVLHRGSVAKETYTANLLRIDDSPIRFVYRPRSLWPFRHTETESLEYRPWLVD
jgi:hypothetical protein